MLADLALQPVGSPLAPVAGKLAHAQLCSSLLLLHLTGLLHLVILNTTCPALSP